MHARIIHSPRSQTGFTMIELMVGLAIGLLLTLVILQVMTVFEAQNRTTIGSADAQTNGGIALYTIGRDLQMAGFSLLPESDSALECTSTSFGSTGITGISPAVITEGVATAGVSASDSITIRYGNSSMGGVLSKITAGPVGNSVTVGNNLGCRVNEIAMVVSGRNCSLTTVTGPPDLATPPVPSSPPNTTTITLQNIPAIALPGAFVACLGAWSEITYSVSNGNLLRNGTPILAGIVNLQAQYGITASASSNTITDWVDASGSTWALPSQADRNRIKALRVAVVARNDNPNATSVTNACSSTTASNPTGLCAWAGSSTSPAPTIDLSPGDTNWQRYRYRVFESVIPLRNIIWSKDTL